MSRRLSSALLAALPCAVVLAFLPGLSFYYDVIPKAAALLVGAGLLCLWTAWNHELPQLLLTSRAGRWNGILAGIAILVIVGAAVSSPLAPLAWAGSEWRRLGGLMQVAIVTVGFLSSAVASQSVEHRLALVRGLCGAGIAAALYATLQYLGWDPWIDAAGYHFGEGEYRIVRPPGPMGHSNYLAAFLLWPVFGGLGLWRGGERTLGGISAAACTIAIVLCGSRGAWAGLVAGAMVVVALSRPSMRMLLRGFIGVAIAFAAFYLSPFGEQLRARMFWIGEDSAGGARFLLWRDSLRMWMERPLLGFGPDTFAAEFPRFQSAELSRQFPDFYHESPHNLFLDALVGQGAVGALVLLGWIGLGVYAAKRGSKQPLAVALLAGLVASVVAQQFAALVVPTAFALVMGIGLLVSLDETKRNAPTLSRVLIAVPCVALAVVFLFSAQRMLRADFALAEVQKADASSTAELWRATKDSSISADLYFSRRWTVDAVQARTASDKLAWAQLAGEAAVAATGNPEQQQNAWYNLAILQASANNATGVEESLRAAIDAAPTWYKPHWTLARLLARTGRMDDARGEARIALDLNGHHDAEVVATMEEILRSARSEK